ncbi:ABC transporter permease [Hyphobacterium sp. CCMP332]|nr:ABC transporter permease [Hyphobacterium sp. CCMP332]
MIFNIAWRNIWRSKVRSFVVITAIGLGLWAGIFASAFVEGMMISKVNSVIEMEMSHFQFHVEGFRDDMKAEQIIHNTVEIQNDLSEDANVIQSSARVIALAMLGTANKNGSVKVSGVDPEKEAIVTKLDQKIKEGAYFEGIKRNPIIISREIAETFKVNLRSKMVLTFQDINGEIVAGAFRVAGIYKSNNGQYDKLNVFVKINDMRRLMNMTEEECHEIAVKVNDHDLAETLASKYQKKYFNLEVLPWLDIASGMRYMVEAMDVYLFVLVGIILLALLFSIINTMYMAVLERTREIGMLMSIGMTKGRIFSMIMIETVIMTMIGCPLGLALSWLSISYFGNVGINVNAAVYDDFGFGSTIYPALDASRYVDVAFMVLIMALIAAVFPARKALKLKPVEAIRKI